MHIYATKPLGASTDVAFYCILARTQPLGIQEKIDIQKKKKKNQRPHSAFCEKKIFSPPNLNSCVKPKI